MGLFYNPLEMGLLANYCREKVLFDFKLCLFEILDNEICLGVIFRLKYEQIKLLQKYP